MRWPAMAPRDRRALRLGAFVVAPVLFALLVVQPWRRTLADASDGAAMQRASLARELAALRDASRDSLVLGMGWRALVEEGARLVDGADAVAASAELASYVADQVTEGGLELIESETRPEDEDGATAAVAIRARGDVLAVLDVLRRLEEGPRLAIVERLTIDVAPEAGAEGEGALVLTAVITAPTRRTALAFGQPAALPAAKGQP